MALPKRCIERDCYAWAELGSSRCTTHSNGWGQRPSAALRGYGGAWSSISKQVIAEYVAVHGWTCPVGHPSRDLTVDHIVPLSQGGTHDRANLRVLCRIHNTSRAVRASNARRR